MKCPKKKLRGGRREVVYAADCSYNEDADDPFGVCPCGFDYAEECGCPGPTQDDMEYKEVRGVLFGRKKP